MTKHCPLCCDLFVFVIDNSSCTGVKCSQLCLPKPNNTHVCTCGDGLELDPKTKKCKCLGGLITLKNGTCKSLSKSDYDYD